jgi:hypothetical protein
MNNAERHADKLIEVYLNWVMSADMAAGWHQPSVLQSLIEFRGWLPPPTGNDQADLKMIREVEFIRRPHALLPEARELIGRLPQRHRTCLLIHEHTAGTYDRQGKRWTERRIAEELGMTVRQYRYYRGKGMEALVQMIRNFSAQAA